MKASLGMTRRSLLGAVAVGAAAGVAGGTRAWADSADATFEIADAPGKRITAMDFGYNAPFHFTALYHGTLPASDPRSRRREFASALRAAGVGALRFPGGKPALLYLAAGEDQTKALTEDLKQLNPSGAKGGYDPSRWSHGYYVRLEDFLGFCRDYDIEPIYQLNTAFYYDEAAHRTRAIVPTRYVVRPDGSVLTQYYDKNRIDEATRAVDEHVRHLQRHGYRIRYWEIGNEEMAEYDTTWGAVNPNFDAIDNYARVVTSFGHAIRSHVRDADITISGYRNWRGEPWDVPLLERIGELDGSDVVDHVAVHYPFSQEHNPTSGQQRLTEFVTTDMGIQANIATTQSDLDQHGFGRVTANVTETSAYRLPKWRGVDVNPTVAKALVWGHNFGQLIFETDSKINVKHDLESYFYGGLVYDCVLDPAVDTKGKRNLHWIGPDGQFLKPLVTPVDQIPAANWFRGRFFATPQLRANALVSRAVGGRTLPVTPGSLNQLVSLFVGVDDAAGRPGSNDRPWATLIFVNQSAQASTATVSLPGWRTPHAHSVQTRVLAAHGSWGLEGILPGEYRLAGAQAQLDLRRGEARALTTRVPAYSLTRVTIHLAGR